MFKPFFCSAANASEVTNDSSADEATEIRSFTLPFTCTTTSIRPCASFATSTVGHGLEDNNSLYPNSIQSSSVTWGANGANNCSTVSSAERDVASPTFGYK